MISIASGGVFNRVSLPKSILHYLFSDRIVKVSFPSKISLRVNLINYIYY